MDINRKIFETYAALEATKRDAEEQQKALKPQILAVVKELPEGLAVKGVGIFLASSWPKWQYSEAVMDLEAKITKMKKEEEATGTAVRIETEPFPVFRPEKTKSDN